MRSSKRLASDSTGADQLQVLKSLRDSPHYVRVLGIFVVASFLAIFTTTVALSQYLANYMTTNIIMRDAVVSVEFLNSIYRVEMDNPQSTGGQSVEIEGNEKETSEFFSHVSQLPDVFRANVYDASGEVILSSDPKLTGQSFKGNYELELALRGQFHPEIVVVDRGEKQEHVGLPDHVDEFVEFYVPIWSEDESKIIGAVEIYKAPEELLATVRGVVELAWIGALISGAVLFTALMSVVLYAARILKRQELKLMETERLAVLGEMASAVAHGLRNPLAAIRSSAELVADDDIPRESKSTVKDIMDQVDRLEAWIRSFLTSSRTQPDGKGSFANVDLIIQDCLLGFEPQLRNRGIVVEQAQGSGSPMVAAAPAELEQVLSTIISNAIEAMDSGGALKIGWHAVPDGRIAIEVSDTGPGLSEEEIEKLFVPFQTSKSSGLGIGLALGRGIAERIGGSLDLKNRAETGVEVTLTVPVRA